MNEHKIDVKEELKTLLHYYEKRLDTCTMEEIKSAHDMLISNMEIYGTIKDFAEFYGVSEANVRNTISRKMIAKPKRKVLYPFHLFQKIIPDKWRTK